MTIEYLQHSKKWQEALKKMNDEQITQLEKYIIDFKSLRQLPGCLYKLCFYDRNCYDFEERVKQIKELNRDSVSEKSYILRYGKDEGLKRREARNLQLKKTTSKKYLSDKFGEDAYHKMRKSISQEVFINKHGKIEGNRLWAEYKKKFKHSHSLQGYIEKYGKDKGNELYKKKIEMFKKTNSLDGFIERANSIEVGKKNWEEKNNKIAYKNSREYYIEIYGEENGLKILRETKDNLSLKSFKKRFGEEGAKKYFEYCQKMSDLAKKNDSVLHFKPENFYSKVSQELFWLLEYKLTEYEKQRSMFGSKNKEWFIRNANTIFFFDYKLNDKIIEFDGTYWHSTEDAKNKDAIKENILKERGFLLLRISEYDFRKNPMETVNKCLNFIRNEKNEK